MLLFLTYYGSVQQVCIFVALLCVWYWYFKLEHKQKVDSFLQRDVKRPVGVWSKYEELITNRFVTNSKSYHVYKAPNQLKYIYIHANIRSILEELDFLLRFQPELLIDLIIMMEKFLQIHYNVMIEKYDACAYIPVLLDIEKDIINMFNGYVFNLPDKSTTLDIPDLDRYMQSQSKQIHAFTSRMITIAKKKYNPKCNYTFAFDGFDKSGDKHMIL